MAKSQTQNLMSSELNLRTRSLHFAVSSYGRDLTLMHEFVRWEAKFVLKVEGGLVNFLRAW
jgi:hypothetical protein